MAISRSRMDRATMSSALRVAMSEGKYCFGAWVQVSSIDTGEGGLLFVNSGRFCLDGSQKPPILRVISDVSVFC